MSIVFPYWDSKEECLAFSNEEFTLCDYFVDQECNNHSTKLLGRYKRTVKWSINPTTPYEQHIIKSIISQKKENINDRIGNCKYLITQGIAKFLSERIDLNPDYDPEFWQQEYDAQLEAIAQAEAEGYHIF